MLFLLILPISSVLYDTMNKYWLMIILMMIIHWGIHSICTALGVLCLSSYFNRRLEKHMNTLAIFYRKIQSSYEEVKTVVIIKANKVQLDLPTGITVLLVWLTIQHWCTPLLQCITGVNEWSSTHHWLKLPISGWCFPCQQYSEEILPNKSMINWAFHLRT